MILATALVMVFFTIARWRAEKAGLCLRVPDLASCAILVGAICVAGAVARDVASIVVLAAVATSAVTDRQTGYIFDVVVGCALACILIAAAASGTLASSVIGAALCGVPLGIVHALTRGRGLGLGDVKLAAVIGMGFTAPSGPMAVGSAFVLGAIVGSLALIRRRASRTDAVPFGPYLALGSIAVAAMRGIW